MTRTHRSLRSIVTLGAAAAAAAIWPTLAPPLSGQYGVKAGEWRYWGGDAGSTKYSPLDQINKDNVKNLRIAWRWQSENFGPRPELNWEVTPLMIGGVLYFTAGARRDVVAVDGVTGETLWIYRLDEGERGARAARRVNRAVAFWTDGRGDERIVYMTPGYHLVALNAKTGLPIPGFGANGIVNLYKELDRPEPKDGQISSSSPPMIVRDTVVVGAALTAAAPSQENIAGFIRGYDIHTGKRTSIFHTIPTPGELGNDTWEKDSWAYTGNTGAWAPMSADEELGYVYVPVETPTGDRYGGPRPGDNLFADSLVCLDAKTGKRVWHFQLTHHDIWDYDLPTAPNLVDITVNGKRIKAVAQVTKQAFTYVFDRVTGEPVWPIVERPVPQSEVPGEKTSKTQPFPTRPAPFDRQGLTEDDVIDFTPALKAEALKTLGEYQHGPIFTPPIVAGANGKKALLQVPTDAGGANWKGAAVDPETGMLYVSSLSEISQAALVHDPKRSTIEYIGSSERYVEQDPKTRVTGDGLGPQQLPLIKPPYGRITAIDLNTGDHAWMIANSDTPDSIKNHPALKGVTIPRTGQPEHVGLLLTKTLLFAGEGGGLIGTTAALGGGGPMFRAIDKKSGEIVWEFKLPGRQSGVPMTYMVNGKQYIAVAVGAPGMPAQLIVLALP